MTMRMSVTHCCKRVLFVADVDNVLNMLITEEGVVMLHFEGRNSSFSKGWVEEIVGSLDNVSLREYRSRNE